MEKSYKIPKKLQIDEKWKKPATFVYEDNYGYGFQFYQPLIEYLDTKEKGRASHLNIPHIPWNDRRSLERFGRNDKITSYSKRELKQLADEAQWKAKRRLESECITSNKRSDISLSGIVSAASLNKHIESATLSDKVLRKKQQIFQDINMEDDFFVEPYMHPGVRLAKDALKGRSAKSIESQLKFESFKNLSENTDLDIKGFQRRHAVTFVHDSLQHRAEMNQREIVLNDNLENLLKPLDDLRFELEGFDHKTTEYFIDKRYYCM